MTERLYTVLDIARELGQTKMWVHGRLVSSPNAPRPDFTANARGGTPILLWKRDSLPRWHTYKAGNETVSGNGHYAAYSDHRAVNKVGRISATWKLWWRNTHDGRMLWWFSTPVGWWISDDDGASWRNTGLFQRPGDYHYYRVNGNVTGEGMGVLSAAWRSTLPLKRELEKWSYL